MIAAPLPLDRLAGELDGHEARAGGPRRRRCWSASGGGIGRSSPKGGELVGGCARSSSRVARRVPGLDGIVWVRDRGRPQGRREGGPGPLRVRAASTRLRDTRREVVGVEKTDTDPSQVALHADHEPHERRRPRPRRGKTALVYALLGGDGQFGVKGSAERLLPSAPDERPSNLVGGPRSELEHWLPAGRCRCACAAAAGAAPCSRASSGAGVVRENYRGLVLPAASGC